MKLKRLKARLGLLVATSATHVGLITTMAAGQTIHVTKAGSPAPTGEASAPYHMVEAGIVRTLTSPATVVQIEAGNYYDTFTVDAPCTLTATGGTVTIGSVDYSASTTLQIITLNTHLFGDVAGPSWMDYERAEDIADFFGGPNPWADVVGFQEIWDEDLFTGGDGAVGIWPKSEYAYGRHAHDDDVDCEWDDSADSGLGYLSNYPLGGWKSVQFEEEYCGCWGFCEPWDCRSCKGWVEVTIVKDGFPIHLFNTHTQADHGDTRNQQISQLSGAIRTYREANPGHVVFTIGDFNVRDTEDAYDAVLVSQMGNYAGGFDAERNSPGFIFESDEQWTSCPCNPLGWYFGARDGERLDYMFYFPSLDGSVEVLPNSINVLQFTGRMLSDDDLTTDQSSDHWSVHGQFTLIRR